MNVYIEHPTLGYRVLTPWRETYDKIYEIVKDLTLLSKERVYYLLALASHAINVDGDFAECGVYRGGSALALAYQMALAGAKKRLHLFDRFEESGFSFRSDSESSGRNKLSYQGVANRLRAYDFVRIHRGEIPSSLKGVEGVAFSFVHIDLNDRISTRDATAFFYDRMVPGGLILFDDYGFPMYSESVKRAVDEFFADKKEEPIILGSGQSFVIGI